MMWSPTRQSSVCYLQVFPGPEVVPPNPIQLPTVNRGAILTLLSTRPVCYFLLEGLCPTDSSKTPVERETELEGLLPDAGRTVERKPELEGPPDTERCVERRELQGSPDTGRHVERREAQGSDSKRLTEGRWCSGFAVIYSNNY